MIKNQEQTQLKATQRQFNSGQGVAINTYNAVMINAFELIKATAKDFRGSIFDDFIILYNDKTYSKAKLANEINGEITDGYRGAVGLYAEQELKQAASEYSIEWLINVNNKALEAVKALNAQHIDFC